MKAVQRALAWGAGIILILLVVAGMALPQAELLGGSAPERAGPGDRISESQILIRPDNITIEIPNARWARFAGTGSMRPFLDTGANSIEVVPESPEDIRVGDIISYHTGAGIVVHRVIALGTDQDGRYYTVKGDNNATADPVKVRFDDINGVLVAIIY